MVVVTSSYAWIECTQNILVALYLNLVLILWSKWNFFNSSCPPFKEQLPFLDLINATGDLIIWCIHMCARAHTHTHIHTRTCIHTHNILTNTRTRQTQPHACTHACTHRHTYVLQLKQSPLVVVAQTTTGHLFLNQQTQHICGGPVCNVAPTQVDH